MDRFTEISGHDFQCNNMECRLGYCSRECNYYQRIINKLAEYENAEEQGLLLKLPCKIGDTIYTVYGTKVEVEEIIEIRLYKNDKSEFIYQYLTYGGYTYFDNDDIGKFVFFTYEEAENKRVERFGK